MGIKLTFNKGYVFPDTQLTYLRESIPPQKKRVVTCECACGIIKDIRLDSIRKSERKTQSCGCLQLDAVTIHGENRTPIHNAWIYMKRRVDYDENYIKQGITIHKPWRQSYFVFRDWALVNGFSDDTPSLERVITTLNYCPENCIFIPVNNQPKNQTTSKFWYVFGIKYNSKREAGQASNVSPSAILRWCEGYTCHNTGKVYNPKPNCWSELKYPK